MARSLNRVQLIGNLTRDPELRYTPTGAAVCSFGIATNRSWTIETGEKKEETEFHRIVAWNKLAELCSQFLTKGRKVYLEGRLSTRNWQAQDGQQRSVTEIVIDDMILLDSRGAPVEREAGEQAAKPAPAAVQARKTAKKETSAGSAPAAEEEHIDINTVEEKEENINPDDIPF